MFPSKLSALSLIVALSGIVRGEEVTHTLVAPAIGITSVSVLGVEGDETTFALYQTADDGATTFIQTMVADATDIADVFPAPSFVCNFHSTAKGKMQCIEADATSTAVISVNVQTLVYAVNDAVATAPSPSLHVQPTITQNPSAVSGESSIPTSSGLPDTQSTNPATGKNSISTPSGSSTSASSLNESQTSSAPSTTPSSAALPAFQATYNKMAMVLGLVAALAL
ncbi:hypothetical protein DFH08DRAFT_151094 [Mycena albidolilacea]|uniref:Uncharacterized protein n=1 Tax=Mycena albidolilacea TaxID=1033008 RepID=A0AAD7A371_9AGAR|nr:hypothetical protein DFH08DRAFT_151094 [Mycena albidolilacea]